MDNSFQNQATDTHQSSGFLFNRQIFVSILDWLAGFIQLTEEEQDDAGIYLDRLGRE